MKRNNTFRAIIKRPDEKSGHVSQILKDPENIRKILGGDPEYIPVCFGVSILVNAKARLNEEPFNFMYGRTTGEQIFGTVIVAGMKGSELCDCPLSMNLWKSLLSYWNKE